MSWVRYDDDHPDHPKVAMVPTTIRAQAMWLNHCALCWSNRKLMDGFIPDGKLGDLYTLGDCDPVVLAKALRKAKIWERRRGGWLIHDYGDFQPTKVEVEAKRVVEHETKVAAGKVRAASAERSAGGTFVSKQAGQNQQTPADDQQRTSSAPAGDQPRSRTQALEPVDQTPVSSRSSGSEREERGSYPQAEDPTIAIETYIGKLDRDLTADETRSVKRWVREYGSDNTRIGIGYAAQDGFVRDPKRVCGQIKALAKTGVR